MTTEEKKQKKNWFDLATQYYVSARFAAFASLLPTCGNLYHHALEMYLKGYLFPTVNTEKLKTKYHHNLKSLWDKFKLEISDPTTLGRFDNIISELHKFEEIRYEIPHGMTSKIVFGNNLPESFKKLEAKYNLDVHELDQLVAVIFEKSSINPSRFTQLLNSHARQYLEDTNPVADQLVRASVTTKKY